MYCVGTRWGREGISKSLPFLRGTKFRNVLTRLRRTGTRYRRRKPDDLFTRAPVVDLFPGPLANDRYSAFRLKLRRKHPERKSKRIFRHSPRAVEHRCCPAFRPKPPTACGLSVIIKRRFPSGLRASNKRTETVRRNWRIGIRKNNPDVRRCLIHVVNIG